MNRPVRKDRAPDPSRSGLFIPPRARTIVVLTTAMLALVSGLLGVFAAVVALIGWHTFRQARYAGPKPRVAPSDGLYRIVR